MISTNPNPYDPPGLTSESDVVKAGPTRQSLAELIQLFLDSRITAFTFDERLDEYRESDDAVIRHVVDAVWYHYDDCDDHLVCFSKQQWDYFQRLLLVLASDCRVETESQRRWSGKQLIAAVSLCTFIFFAVQAGWGQHLLLLSIPFGAVSIALSFWRSREADELDPFAPIIFPFATFSDLASAYRSSGFRKTRYPKHIGARTIRSPLMTSFWQLHAYAMWMIFSPFPLLFQTFPEIHSTTRIVAEKQIKG